MKKINLLLIAISSVLLFSCEEDDGTSFVREDYLLGKWNVTQVGELSPQNIVNYTDYQSCNANDPDNLIFDESNSYTESNFKLIDSECKNEVISGTYNRNSNNFTVTYIKDENTLQHIKKILSLTYEEMEITYTDTITDKIIFKKLTKATE